MARYEASSIEFGEKLQSDLIKRKKDEAKEQEKFAKKITAANFVVKGANEFLKNRVDTFNTSLLDEKAFLTTAQKNAANILSTKSKLDKELSQAKINSHTNMVLQKLPIKMQIVFNLKTIGHFKPKEIAQIKRMHLSQVNQVLTDTQNALKISFRRRFIDE